MTVLNLEFDSRILRVSSGAGGITRPGLSSNGKLQEVFCLHCGDPGGAVTAEIPPAMRGDPGVIYVCPACDGTFGKLPLTAVSFVNRRES